jgi:DNA-binding transcriptional LysR family regulator
MTSTRESKPPVSLTGLLAFESVARHMNFARAAEELEVSPTAISKTVKHLEAQLRVRLFNRTTRSVGLTELGSQLLNSLAPALDLIKDSVQQVGETAGKPTGLLRINTPYVAFASLIQPHQAEFVRRFPDVTLEVVIDDKFVDIVASGYDAGIRRGHNVQRDMIAVPIGAVQRMVVVAAPSYLRKHGAPRVPKDLLEHDCIRLRFGRQGRFFEWRFGPRDKPVVIDVHGRLIYSEMRCVIDAARQGLGLAYVFRQFAEEHIRSGQLVPVLEKPCAGAESFYLYYPHRAQMPGKLRAFVDFMQEATKRASNP